MSDELYPGKVIKEGAERECCGEKGMNEKPILFSGSLHPDCCAAPVGFTIGIILGVPIAALICGWEDAVTNGVMMMLGAFGLWISQKL